MEKKKPKRPSPEVIRLLARAGRLFGVPPDLFWVMTPAELKLVEKDWFEEFRAENERQDRRTARILAMMNNVASKNKKGEDDFMPKIKTEVSDKDLFAKVVMINNVFNSKYRWQ